MMSDIQLHVDASLPFSAVELKDFWNRHAYASQFYYARQDASSEKVGDIVPVILTLVSGIGPTVIDVSVNVLSALITLKLSDAASSQNRSPSINIEAIKRSDNEHVITVNNAPKVVITLDAKQNLSIKAMPVDE